MVPKKLNEHIKNLSKEQNDDYKLLLKIDLLNDKKNFELSEIMFA